VSSIFVFILNNWIRRTKNDLRILFYGYESKMYFAAFPLQKRPKAIESGGFCEGFFGKSG